MIILLNWILLKSFADPTLYLNLTSLNYSISTKIIKIVLSVISPSFLHQVVGKLTLNPISPNSSFCFRFYNYLSLQFYWLLPFTLRLSVKLYIKADFSFSICIEDSILNATETAVCSFPFYWCPIC